MSNARISDLIRETVTHRYTRRQMLKRAAALGLSVPALNAALAVASASPTFAQAAAAAFGPSEDKLEIFSWWTSGGEAAALAKLFEVYKAKYPKVDIVNSAVAGGGGSNAQAVLQTRLSGHNPPDSWQSHPGYELMDQYVNPGYAEPINDLYQANGWDKVIPKELIDGMTKGGNIYAVPAGVHRGNVMFYNKKVLAEANVEVGQTLSFDEFFKAADALKAKSIPAFSVGDKDPFVDAQLFENTVLGVLGPDKYQQLWKGQLSFEDAQVKEAMQTYGKLWDYANPDHSGLTWDQGTGLMIAGKTAFHEMGDWAYGEVVKKNAQADIGWVAAPGTDGSFVIVCDTFTLAKNAPHPNNAKNWLLTVGSKEAQEEFNPLKGSIPPRTDVDKAKFDAYHQWSLQGFATAKLVFSVAHGEAAPPQFKQDLYDAATEFVSDKDVDTFASTLETAAKNDKLGRPY